MRHGAKGSVNALEASGRQFTLCSDESIGGNWKDVPDALIAHLVREYTRGGDAILFGTSRGGDVCAIRIYRGREPYAVYFRKPSEVGEAVERLYRMRPPRKRAAEPSAERVAVAQGVRMLPLPFHPKFTVNDLIKQRRDAKTRAIEWRQMVSAAEVTFNRLYN